MNTTELELLKSWPIATLQGMLKKKQSFIKWLEHDHPEAVDELEEQKEAAAAIEAELFLRRGLQ